MNTIPSLSRLLDTKLLVEVVAGEVTSMDNMETITVSIPTDDYNQLASQDLEFGYLRPMIKALATKINRLGNVKAKALTLPKGEMAWLCTNGSIPVVLRIVRRKQPDRHQILIHALVQPILDPKVAAILKPLASRVDEKIHKNGIILSEAAPEEGEPIRLRCDFAIPDKRYEDTYKFLRKMYLNSAVDAIIIELQRVADGNPLYATLPEFCLSEGDNAMLIDSKVPLVVVYYHYEGKGIHMFRILATAQPTK